MQRYALGDICEIVSGSTPKTNIEEYWNGDIKWITPAELDEESYIINDTARKITKVAVEKTGISSFPKGTVLLSSRAPIGKVAIAGCEMYCNQGFKNLICKEKVYNRYLYWFLKRNTKYLNSLGRGATFKEISKQIVSEIEINLPEMEHQKIIVEILEKLMKIIRLRKLEIKKLEKLKNARFVEMFEGRGKVVLLTNYVWFQEGPGVRSVDFAVEGTNLLTGSNINDNELSFGYKSDRFISNELANGKYSHFMCDKDDILVVSSAIAPEKFDQKVVIVEEDKKYCLNTGIIRFKPNREVMTLGYFREFLKTDYFKHQVMAEMRGIAQMHFGPSHLKQMTILLPESMEQQIEFEKFITQVNKSKVEVQRALDEAQLLFDSLMQKYFG